MRRVAPIGSPVGRGAARFGPDKTCGAGACARRAARTYPTIGSTCTRPARSKQVATVGALIRFPSQLGDLGGLAFDRVLRVEVEVIERADFLEQLRDVAGTPRSVGPVSRLVW